MRIDSPVMTNAIITGSFSGSFVGSGNFEGLEADSVEFANVLNKPTLLSGSAQIASDISGSFGSVSGSLAARVAQNESDIANLDGNYATDAELNASSSALITAYQNADTTLSSSLATDIATNLASINALDDTYATDTALTALSSSVAGDISSIDTAVPAIIDSSGTPAFNTGITKAEVLSILNVEDGADVTDTANVEAAGALMDSEVTNLAQVKAFDSSDYATAAQGTKADNALPEADVDADIKTLSLPANTTISSFGASLVDDADASAARTTLGVDASGTDNSTDVTLVTTSHNYLSLSDQAITLGQIDISDDTNLVGGDGIDLTGDTLSVDSSVARTNADKTFGGTQTFNNIVVNGTGSFAVIQSVTGSAKIIGDAYIVLNNDTPSERYAGLAVYDSGSAGVTASLEFDGETNDWFYEYSDDGGVTTDHGVVMFGPEYSTKGSPTYNTNNTVLKSNGGHHTLDSNITDNGSTITLGSNTTVSGNITVTGTVDGRDVAADGTKLDGIDDNANNYTHPTHPGDDAAVDTGALTGATVISDLDFNITTDGLGHVTDANATVATRDLTKADIGLGNVENTALSTWAGSSNITTLGTIGTGTWNGSVIASAYLDADTAHLSGTQTFTGTKTFSNNITVNGIPFGKDLSADTDSIAIGSNALDSTTSGTSNIAIGSSALTAATTGFGNIAIGKGSLQSVTTGTNTVAIGESAANNLTSGFSVAIGWYALNSVQQSSLNTAVGPGALRYIQADGNTAVGYNAGAKDNSNANQTDSSYSVYIGSNTTTGTGTNVTNEIVIGYDAEGHGSNTATFGNSNITANYFTGVVRTTGDVVAYYSSDERLKDNVVEIDGALEKVEALRGVSFDWNDKQDVYEGHDVGVIAQEVEAILPELVQTRDNGYKAVKYEKLTAVLIQAVKELSARVKELENK